MSELYFGYASFVYFLSKRGYTLQSHANKQLAFWLSGQESLDEYDPYQIMYNSESDCGCVVVNSFVFDEQFKDDTNLLKNLKKCERQKRAVHDKITNRDKTDVPHCFEPGHKTTIRNEEIVECKRYTDE